MAVEQLTWRERVVQVGHNLLSGASSTGTEETVATGRSLGSAKIEEC